VIVLCLFKRFVAEVGKRMGEQLINRFSWCELKSTN